MATIKPSYDTNRQNLADVVPLDGPLAMYIEPTRLCNFKCFYCMHSTRGEKGGALEKTGFRLAHMDMALYEKLVRDIMAFPSKVKRICFSGLGEPLMNPHLPEMIRMLREAGFDNRIDAISNGTFLTHELTDALIEAGLNRVQLSIQGLNQQQYLENCGVAPDLDKLKSELEYFHKRAEGTGTTLYIKMIDSMLKSEADKEQFYQMFSHMCDTIFVEHLVILEQQMGDHGGRTDGSRNLQGEYVEKREVCPIMFYYLQINVDGDVFPCSPPGLPTSFSMGNIKEQTLQEVWNGTKRHNLMCKNLTDGYDSIPACVGCSCCVSIADKSEYLDDRREEILARITKQ